MSATTAQLRRERAEQAGIDRRIGTPEKRIPPESARLRSQEQEIENLKRLMSHVIQRLDALKTR